MHADRLRRALPGIWLGVLLCIALLATPAVFATLDRTQAAPVVAAIFVKEAWLSLVLAVVLLWLERARTRAATQTSVDPLANASVFSAEVLLLLGTVFCTVAGYFGLQPLMPAARLGQGTLSFGQLHALSTVLFGVKALLLAALAWRATRRHAPGT